MVREQVRAGVHPQPPPSPRPSPAQAPPTRGAGCRSHYPVGAHTAVHTTMDTQVHIQYAYTQMHIHCAHRQMHIQCAHTDAHTMCTHRDAHTMCTHRSAHNNAHTHRRVCRQTRCQLTLYPPHDHLIHNRVLPEGPRTTAPARCAHTRTHLLQPHSGNVGSRSEGKCAVPHLRALPPCPPLPLLPRGTAASTGPSPPGGGLPGSLGLACGGSSFSPGAGAA